MSVQTKETYTEVASIEGPGSYRFSRDPNQEFRYFGGTQYSDSLSVDYPQIDYKLPRHLKEKYPFIAEQRFHPALLYEGQYRPARIEYFSRWRVKFNGQTVIMLDGEIYKLSMGGSDNSFVIQDIGNLLIVDNLLRVEKPQGRDGEFKLFGNGPSYKPDEGNFWKGFITVTGEKPGRLVTATIDYVNEVKREQNIPLWKKNNPAVATGS